MARLHANPSAATATSVAMMSGTRPSAASRPASNVPNRIARNVPISISALPPTSSSSRSTSGSRPYFAGAKNVECMPIMKARRALS
jgi:hypothetical protein